MLCLYYSLLDRFIHVGQGEPFVAEAGKPLLVSLMVYCNERWKAEWDAETLFLNSDSGAGIIMQPRPGLRRAKKKIMQGLTEYLPLLGRAWKM